MSARSRLKRESSLGEEVAWSASLLRRIDSLNRIIRSHAGGLELVELTPEGEAVVRYTGMCAGCDYRPSTTAGTVEPALLDVPGVRRVTVLGSRIDEDALATLRVTLHDAGAPQRAVRLTRRMEGLEP